MLRRFPQLGLLGQPGIVRVLPRRFPQVMPDPQHTAHGHIDPAFGQLVTFLGKLQQLDHLGLYFHRPLACLLVDLV